MKSNVCLIKKGSKDLGVIFNECEKVAVYNELNKKQTLHLRLLCEELDGMLPELVGDFEGKLWIEFVDNICKINVSFELADISSDRKDQLINLAKNKKNAAAVGVVGKIRSVVENFFLDVDFVDSLAMTSGAYTLSTGYDVGVEYSYYWSLGNYKTSVKKDEKNEAWDELEKSVIASVADDVVVGIKGKQADIIIIKKFA